MKKCNINLNCTTFPALSTMLNLQFKHCSIHLKSTEKRQLRMMQALVELCSFMVCSDRKQSEFSPQVTRASNTGKQPECTLLYCTLAISLRVRDEVVCVYLLSLLFFVKYIHILNIIEAGFSYPAGCSHQTRLHLGAAAAATGCRESSCRRSMAPSLARWWKSGGQCRVNHCRVNHWGAGSFAETAQPAAGGAAEAAGCREPV